MTYYDYMKEHPDANAKIAVLTADANEVAIPMRKGDETAPCALPSTPPLRNARRRYAEGIEREVLRDGYLHE